MARQTGGVGGAAERDSRHVESCVSRVPETDDLVSQKEKRAGVGLTAAACRVVWSCRLSLVGIRDSIRYHPTQDRQRRQRSLIPCVRLWVCGSGSRAPAPAVPGARPRGCDNRVQLGMWTMPTGHSTRSPGAVARGPTAVRSACTLRAPELGSLRPPAVPLRFRCVHRHSAHTRIGPLSIRLPSPVWTRR